MKIPSTKIEDNIFNINGIKILDQYQWLENDQDDNVFRWVKEQNEYTSSFLIDNLQKIFLEELTSNFKINDFNNPFLIKNRYFYKERQSNENQPVLYFKDGLNGVPVELINPNNLNNGINIDYYKPSRSGKYVAYGLSALGNEMATLYVIDVNKKNNLSDIILNCRHSSICWLPDDSGFFYTKNSKVGEVPKNEEHLHQKVYLHIIGDDSQKDELIFGKDRPKDDKISLSISLDGKYLAINVSSSWTENDIYIYEKETKKITPIILNIKSKFSLKFLKDKVILYTDYKANNYRLLSSSYDNLFNHIDEWQEFIPETKYLLKSVNITKDKILLEYLMDVCSAVSIFDHTGNEIGEIPLPKYSSIINISTNREESEFFYSINSFTFPSVIYRFDPIKNEYSLFRKIDNIINSDNYEIKQEWYLSKDNTKVPVFIIHKKNILLNSKNPTILNGYGGFENSITPFFLKSWIPWLERGGVFVIANIRGGGEFGEKWHKDGIKNNKQNSFDDFIYAAKYLISQKYTSSEHLGIFGASNGGLLVSSVAIQQPDLFKAVCSKVPLTDMVRFPLFGIASRWVHEYGDPNNKEDLKNILKWSPYHNVRKGVEYPNFLFMTGENDTRVHPLHSRKMTALLQNTNRDNKIMLYTEFGSGHGHGKPINKIVENQSIILSFFSKFLGF